MSSAALAKRVVITPTAGTPCRSATIVSCRLHDEQRPSISDTGEHRVPVRDLLDDMGIAGAL